MTLARALTGWLEAGHDRGERLYESTLSRLAFPVSRRLELPRGARVIGVGGATLGGSGRTPLAIAIVDALVARGVSAVLVGHGYGGNVDTARCVQCGDDVAVVGDEALIAAAALGPRAAVVVAPRRAEALAFAATQGDTLVVDRLLQTHPVRLARAVLAVDSTAPWGSGRVVPFGDLSAPRARLIAAADEVIEVGGPCAVRRFLGAELDGACLSPQALAGMRVGLITSVARPSRVFDMLVSHGVAPLVHVTRADHGALAAGELERFAASARHLELALWLADEKTTVRLPRPMRKTPCPIARLATQLTLAADFVERLANAQALY